MQRPNGPAEIGHDAVGHLESRVAAENTRRSNRLWGRTWEKLVMWA